MPNISPQNMTNLIQTTLNDLSMRGEVVDLSSTVQYYCAAMRMVGNYTDAENKVAQMAKFGIISKESSGKQLQFNLLFQDGANARFNPVVNRPPVTPTYKNVNSFGTVPWGNIVQEMCFDRTLPSLQSGSGSYATKVVDMVASIAASLDTDWANTIECAILGGPTTSDSQFADGMWAGFRYNLSPSATEGFEGGARYGSTVNGVDLTTGAGLNYKNWTAEYGGFNQTLKNQVAKARAFTNFGMVPRATDRGGRLKKLPQDAPVSDILTTFEAIQETQTLQTLQNDNVGRDLKWYDAQNSVLIAGMTAQWWPILDNAPVLASKGIVIADDFGTNPMFMISWPSWKYVGLEGAAFREDPAANIPTQVDFMIVNRAMRGNLECISRRNNALLVQAVP